MTNRHSRPRWIAAALVALALLAVVAWWHRPDALRSGSGQVVQAIDAQIATSKAQSRAATTGTARSNGASSSGSKDKDDEAACYSDYRQNLRNYRDRLRPARNAEEAVDRLFLDSLAAVGTPEASVAFDRGYRAARERWPSDLELSWLALGHCGDGCDQDAEVRHLLTVDPDNAAAWTAAMAAARTDRDEQGFAHALQRAANAKFYDSRMGFIFLHAQPLLTAVSIPRSCRTPELMARMRDELGRTPTDDDWVESKATNIEFAQSIPSFAGLLPCLKPDLLTRGQRDQCVALLSRIAGADTLVEQTIALAGLISLQADSGHLSQLRERYRELQWLQASSSIKPLPEHYATRMWSQGEVATMQAIAMERGRWPPPADWLPENPRARALITGEPPPP